MHAVRGAWTILAACLVLFSPDRARAADSSPAVSETDPQPPPVAGSCLDEDKGTAAPDPRSLEALPAIALKDAVYVLGSPVRWTGKDWLIVGGAALGLVFVTAMADVAVRGSMLNHQNGVLDDLTRVVEPFGKEYSWAVLGVYGIAGFVFRDADARDIAIDGAIASVLASGVITPILKRVTGRTRPDEGPDALAFDPFSGADAFPSGHATQAFAVASVISAHSDKLWVSLSAYTLASLVAFSRVYHNDHWVSDVVGGALIGAAVGRGVVALNRRLRSGDGSVRIVFAPIFGQQERGIGVTAVF